MQSLKKVIFDDELIDIGYEVAVEGDWNHVLWKIRRDEKTVLEVYRTSNTLILLNQDRVFYAGGDIIITTDGIELLVLNA